MSDLHRTFVLSKYNKSKQCVLKCKENQTLNQIQNIMANINQPKWPMSWREKMDRMEIGDNHPVDAKVVKSVRYIASKYFHSPKANSQKRFTTKKVEGSKPPEYKLWRMEDEEKEVENVRDN